MVHLLHGGDGIPVEQGSLSCMTLACRGAVCNGWPAACSQGTCISSKLNYASQQQLLTARMISCHSLEAQLGQGVTHEVGRRKVWGPEPGHEAAVRGEGWERRAW